MIETGILLSSAPLWGCELKYHIQIGKPTINCQPPCGAVSWNVHSGSRAWWFPGQPPCGAVSWNSLKNYWSIPLSCQPPCGAVSWNTNFHELNLDWIVSPLVGLWVEIYISSKAVKLSNVSPLVGLWVEIKTKSMQLLSNESASLWGCELKSFCRRHGEHI